MEASATCLHSYVAEEGTELALTEGETITEVDTTGGDWWYGKNSSGDEGYFPAAYVELTGAAPPPGSPDPSEELVVQDWELQQQQAREEEELRLQQEANEEQERQSQLAAEEAERAAAAAPKKAVRRRTKVLRRGDPGWRPPPPKRRASTADDLAAEVAAASPPPPPPPPPPPQPPAANAMHAYVTSESSEFENRISDQPTFERVKLTPTSTPAASFSETPAASFSEEDRGESELSPPPARGPPPGPPPPARGIAALSTQMSSMSAAGEGEGEANDDNWEERESSFAPPPPENPLKKFEDFKARLNKASVNDFVTARFVMVKKGMMGGKVSNETLISWAAKPPKQPLLKGTPTDKKMVAAVADIFAATCSFMSSEEPNHKLMTDIAAKTGQNTDPSVVVALKSELLVFIVKQTNGNPSEEARVRGFELMAQVLRSSRVLPDDGMLLDVLRKITLKKRSEQSAVGGLCCVAFHALLLPEDKRRELGELSREQVEFARNECGAVSSPFDCTLEQVLRYEHLHANPLSTEDPLRLFTVNKWCPRILSALIDVTKCLGGHKHSGIFRLASDKDAIIMLKSEIEKSGYRMLTEIIKLSKNRSKKRNENLSALQALATDDEVYQGITISSCDESADLLKQWLRSLQEPLVPYAFYQTALDAGKSPDLKQTVALFQGLMGSNQATIDYLMDFLVELLEHQAHTLMDENALGVVFSPNLLKNPKDDPIAFARNAENEKRFVVKLIQAKQQDLLLR